MAHPQTLALLTAARKRIEAKAGWQPGEAAYLADGQPCDATDSKAVRWSGWGAYEAAASGCPDRDAAVEGAALLESAAQTLHGATLIGVDDDKGHDAVLEVYDSAMMNIRRGLPAQPSLFSPRAKPAAAATTTEPAKPTPAAAAAKPNGSAGPALASTALAPLEGAGVYRSVDSVADAFALYRERFNILFPVMKPDLIPAMHAIALRRVAIDNRTDLVTDGNYKKAVSADLYWDKKLGQFGLTKIVLDKISAAGGVSWHPAFTGRVDDGSHGHFRAYRACAICKNLDGTPRLITAHKVLDLRDGAPHGMSDAQLGQARLHIDAICESKAMNRAIRKFAFIKGSYTAEELKRPFIVAALVFTGELPPNAPPALQAEVARAMVAQSTSAVAALFGPGAGVPSVQIEDGARIISPSPIGTVASPLTQDDGDPADEPMPWDGEQP